MLEKKVKVDVMTNISDLITKYELGKRLETKYNLKIKIYNSILIKLLEGRTNAFTLIPIFPFRKINKKLKIYVSKNLFVSFPLALFEFVILHEIGHHKSKVHNSEDCADSFALNILGLDEYVKRRTQIDTYFKYRTFDISQLKKLQNISIINFIKVRLHLMSLEDI